MARDKTERNRVGFLKWCQFEGCDHAHVGFGKCEIHYGYRDLAHYNARRTTRRPLRAILTKGVEPSG